MPKKVANHTVVVVRDGKRLRVSPGTSFDFTAAEVAGLNKMSPGTLRNPVNETVEEPEQEPGDGEAQQAEQQAPAGRAAGRGRGGRQAAAAEDNGGL